MINKTTDLERVQIDFDRDRIDFERARIDFGHQGKMEKHESLEFF